MEDSSSNHLQSKSNSTVLFAAGALSGVAEAIVVQPFGK
jgi:hypothetical protein